MIKTYKRSEVSMNTECPKCGTECFIEFYDSSECPNCGLCCWWEDDYSLDYSHIEWEEW